MTQHEIITDLIQRTEQYITTASSFKRLTDKQLNFKENPEKWSILECLEHLNLYGDFYLVEIENRILAAKEQNMQNIVFKSGWLGNYFAEGMLPPTDGTKMKTMKTFKDKDPKSSSLPRTTIDRFIKQQKMMLTLLEEAKKVDLNKIKTNITILKSILKLKLGDTFRFVIFHNYRHILQAEGVRKLL